MDDIITVNISKNDPYDVIIKNDFTALNECMKKLFDGDKKLCIIADENVSSVYGDELVNELHKEYTHVDLVTLKLGEANKSLDTVNKCYSFLVNNKYDRKDVIIALGGGICGDLAGYVSATYMRGIAFVQVPTTLLSMVDSSSGGKTGVNYESYKNMIGAFKMPSLVYINTSTLKSLNDREYASGMAEVLKAGLIRDGLFYEWLINNFPSINDRKEEYVSEMIYKSVNIKKMYVEKDPYEKGDRAILNLGHTVGHALEKYTDFSYSHGECVALGTICAAYLSYKRDNLTMEEYYEIRDMFVPFGLPISLENIDIDRVYEYMKSDKKNISGRIRFILLKKIGKGFVCEDITGDELKDAIKQINFDPND